MELIPSFAAFRFRTFVGRLRSTRSNFHAATFIREAYEINTCEKIQIDFIFQSSGLDDLLSNHRLILIKSHFEKLDDNKEQAAEQGPPAL